ncbi:ComF family protein [Aquabacterium sp.]|uniref:ComF family protein n=1 Tax=Aquabacterium sp. TaxID=1872578 RepID=UPI002B51D01D|nr:ComF family protein [Aquabacterium sp.]HSW03390.1 ComF family protein [Aquabacterium sp.]
MPEQETVERSSRRGLSWPRLCELCRSWAPRSLCADCLQRFAPLRPRCLGCAMPMPGEGRFCGECQREPPPYARCVAMADYGYPWDGLITAFKFRGRVDLAAPLATALTQTLERQASLDVNLVIPVPLNPARLAERGHNQAWEIARRVAAATHLPADAHSLLRLRDTAHQVGLSRSARATNLRHAFWVEPTRLSRVSGRHIALVDDVLTTGVTAAAATRSLLQAGAASVQVWVLARTPRPDE